MGSYLAKGGQGMKVLIIIAAVMSLLAFGCDKSTTPNTGGPSGLDLTGSWNFTFSDVPTYGTVLVNDVAVTQTGSDLVFNLSGNMGNGSLTGSTVTVDNLEITSGVSVNLVGTATATTMNGTWNYSIVSGGWTATKQ